MDIIFTLVLITLSTTLGFFLGYTKGTQHYKELLDTAKESIEIAKVMQAKFEASKLYKDRLKHIDNMPGQEELDAAAQVVIAGFDIQPEKEPAGFNGTPN